jgi:hypothetical protein
METATCSELVAEINRRLALQEARAEMPGFEPEEIPVWEPMPYNPEEAL